MSPVWLEIGTVLTVFTLAIVSPGPNFLLVLNRTLSESRQTGMFTALGVATGSALFALAGMFGLLLMISSLPHFSIISRFIGGSYLAWIGICMLRDSMRKQVPPSQADSVPATTSPRNAYRIGLLTNLTNPKAWAFYLSLFALVVSPSIPLWGKILLVFAMFLISLGWYATVAMMISNQLIQPLFLRVQRLTQAVVGILLIWLGGRILFP